jgi:Xaa-Pro dipeptidase
MGWPSDTSETGSIRKIPKEVQTMLFNLTRAVDLARELRVDALVATSPENVLYASGFWSPGSFLGTERSCVLVPIHEPAEITLVTTQPVDRVVEHSPWANNVLTYGEFFIDVDRKAALERDDERLAGMLALPRCGASRVDALVEAIRRRRLHEAVLAVDESNTRPAEYAALKAALPKARVQAGYDLFHHIRSVKTPEEIARLQRAAAVTERSFAAVFAAAREGTTEREAARAMEQVMIGSDTLPIRTVIGFGAKSAHPNSYPSARRLQRGDMIRLDCGCTYEHYYSDVARCAVLGKPSGKLSTYYRAILAGQQAALEIVRAGVPVREVFDRAVQTVRKEGIDHYRRFNVGHGIGIEYFDPPRLSPDPSVLLEEAMVINVETPYYELGWGGITIEDTVTVTNNGFRYLTTAARNLREIN